MDVKAGSLDSKIRVRHGLERERQIAKALKEQVGLNISDSTPDEDKERKIDRWINYPDGHRVALQIKYREVGEDLLFEVYDKWYDFGDKFNKLGRDMFGDAKEYAVLLSNKKTVVMVPTELAKKTVWNMYEAAQQGGFTVKRNNSQTLFYHVGDKRLELKVQLDPHDHRQKMIAYIPASYFVEAAQAKVYELALPKNWKI